MPSCVMRFCTNYSKKASKTFGITYHRFPTEELRRIEWTNIVRCQRKEDDWQPHSCSKICSVHFKDEDKYTSAKGLILLKKTAIPCLALPGSYEPSLRPDSPNSSNSLEGEDVSEYLETNLESPRTKALNNCLAKAREQKKDWLKRNNNLKKKNKRLKQKVATLSDVLRRLKNNNHLSDEVVSQLDLNEGTMRLLKTVLRKKTEDGENEEDDDDDDNDDDEEGKEEDDDDGEQENSGGLSQPGACTKFYESAMDMVFEIEEVE